MKVLLDSDALFALFVATDVHHSKAKKQFQLYTNKKGAFFVSNLVVQETATVLSNKVSQAVAKDFYQRVIQMPFQLVPLDYHLEQLTWNLFLQQTKKRTSFIDCSNIIIKQELKIDKIFSFDSFYQNHN